MCMGAVRLSFYIIRGEMNLGDKEHKEDFEKEVLQRLTRIEAKQEGISGQCEPCQKKISDLKLALQK